MLEYMNRTSFACFIETAILISIPVSIIVCMYFRKRFEIALVPEPERERIVIEEVLNEPYPSVVLRRSRARPRFIVCD